MSKTTLTAAPSPNGTNKEGLFVRSVLVNRRDMLALDDAYGDGSNSRRRPMGSKLVRALKMRYGSPKSVLRKLGLDEGLLDPNDTDDDGESEQMLLRHRGMSREDIQRLIDGHTARSEIRGGTGGEVGGGAAREGEDTDPPIRRPSPLQSERGSGDEYEPLRTHLRGKGFDEEEIERAIELGKDHVRRRADDKRRRVGRDVLPKSANSRDLAERGGGMGGHLSGGRTDKVFDEIADNMSRIEPAWSTSTGPNSEYARTHILDHGLDARRRGARDRSDEEVDKVHELLSRIEHEPETRTMDRLPHDHPSRRRHAMDAKLGPTEAQVERLHKLIPGLALVGTVSEDGPARRDPGRRNPYEVL